MANKLKWGIVSTGFIAGRFAEGLARSHTGELVGVCSRSLDQAQQFAEKQGAQLAVDNLQSLLASDEIDAIYVATPHPWHLETSLACLKSGKHVLCEKPIGMNAAQAQRIFDCAAAHGKIAREAYMYRCHPQTAAVAKAIANNRIGTPTFIQANFGFQADFDPNGRLFDKRLGGGAILDIGGYPVSMAFLVASLTGSKTLSSLQGIGHLHPGSGADTLATAQLTFASGLIAQVAISTQTEFENCVRIFGERGYIEIPEPWIIASHGGPWSFQIKTQGSAAADSVSGEDARELYGIEADTFAQIVRGETPDAPAVSPEDSIAINQALDQWRHAIGLSYEFD